MMVAHAGGEGRTTTTVTGDRLAAETEALLSNGFRLAMVAGHDDGPALRIVYLFLAGAPDRRTELVLTVPADHPRIPSLAAMSFPASRFERELHDLFGIVPEGHPLPRRMVRHAHWPAGWYPMRGDAGPPPPFTDGEAFPFLQVDGDGVYEIPVGPVHAGMIEPGHFRFSVVGETILKLKARLWFVHRGVERLFQGEQAGDGVALAERISGDTSVGHALAHCLAVEDALGITVPEQAQLLRALLVELERLYNHAADLGALANDVGFGVANAHALRLREQLLRINAGVTGHRLLRTAIRPGGVTLRALPDPALLRAIGEDLAEIGRLTLAHSVVKDRFTGTAVLGPEPARDLGCLGYVARASGVDVDARIDHPFVSLPVRPVVESGGDVLARYRVRLLEFAASVQLIGELVDGHRGSLDLGPGGDVVATATVPGNPGNPSSGLGIVEGWRGTIVHRVEITADGHLSRAKIVDPSWFNWPAVPVALANTIVPDFPLVNKSFNLSYAGNDL
jgi:Ni,Fe-hydrogenase III large subunit/Ni,Fe-hydrogenase III component G